MPRPSHVRDGVRRMLQGRRRHDWSLDDLVDALRQEGVGADYSSVFRAVSYLEEEGTLRRVAVDDSRLRFELTGEHHDHVRCESCGAVEEVPGCLLGEADPNVEKVTGFSITGHQLTFSGVCPNCRQS